MLKNVLILDTMYSNHKERSIYLKNYIKSKSRCVKQLQNNLQVFHINLNFVLARSGLTGIMILSFAGCDTNESLERKPQPGIWYLYERRVTNQFLTTDFEIHAWYLRNKPCCRLQNMTWILG